MGKFNSFEEIISWQKAREFNKRIYLATESNILKKTLILSDRLGEHHYRYHLILRRDLKEIQIKSLFTFYTLLKHQQEKFVPNFI